VTFTQLAYSPDKVTVKIDFGQVCQVGKPVATLEPATQSGSPGSTLNYILTLTNSDLSLCANSQFNLATALPVGWTGVISPTSLVLAPGASGKATISVTAPSATVAGTYGIAVKVSDISNAAHAAEAGGSFIVATSTSTCVRSAPSLTLSPSSQSGSAGAQLRYGVSLTNNDSASCSASGFSLSAVVPSVWNSLVSQSAVILQPGQQFDATIDVTSGVSAAPGTYGFTVQVASGVAPEHVVSGNGAYVVLSNVDSQPPTAPSGVQASVQRKQINVSWVASKDNVAVAGYTVWRNGVKVANVTTASYADKAFTSGSTYTYSVNAYDAAGNVSSQSSSLPITVSSSTSGKR
jgi:hypothetical protein